MLFIIFFVMCIAGGESSFDLPEGSSCNWMGAEGTCVNVRRCESFEYDRQNKLSPPVCSFQGNTPVICCIDCKILPPSKAIHDDLDNQFFKTGRKYEENCLTYQYLLPYSCKAFSPKVRQGRTWNETRKCYKYWQFVLKTVGGVDARRGEFPHMALLGYGEDMESAQWRCGGSLISDRHILTAAHCASDVELGPVRFVALGMLKRSDPPHFWKRYHVKLFLPHPEYQAPYKYHDIAIIETETTVNLTAGVRPACLTHKHELQDDEEAYATGWGSLGPGKDPADVMQQVALKKFTEEECGELYPTHRHLVSGFNHTTQMCYGNHELPKDTCQGDSGGPLQMRDHKAKYCAFAIIGVTSYGRACGAAGAAGVYTRVSHYLPWIESIVWP